MSIPNQTSDVQFFDSPPWDMPASSQVVMSRDQRHTEGMPLIFHGSLQELKDRTLPLDIDGDWEAQPNGVWKLRCRDRSGMLWAETTGRIWFDGPQAVKTALEAKVQECLGGPIAVQPASSETKIFVVHGRDHEARDQLRLILFTLRLDPFVLQVTGGGGDTLIEALEKMIGKSAQSAFGIVLMTPDDMGYLLKEEKPEDAKPRARQNVVMEMGMLLASLTRRRCAILQKGFVELPSNMSGVITIPFNNHVRETVPKLVQRLKDAGFKLDPSAIGEAQG